MEHRAFQGQSRAVSFGRYLKAIREHQGIALHTVAERICVNLWQLTLIEAEDHDRLPSEVYVKGILRAYAKQVGVDPDDVIERYNLNRAAYQQAARAEADILTSGKQSVSRMLLALSVLLVIVCGSLYGFYALQNGIGAVFSGQGPQENKSADKPAAAPETGGKDGVSRPAPRAVETQTKEKLSLTIDAVAETTINVQIDSKKYTKYRLEPNDEVQLEATRRFNLLISDADGVRLRLNGQPVNVPGEPGRSVNLVLPQDDGDR
ncbi:MAG: RodZ domain-containing protein [Thermodesulfobacteriota bacterium]